MRNFTEATLKNSLRTPKILGLSAETLAFWVFLVILVQIFVPANLKGNLITLFFAVFGYLVLRAFGNSRWLHECTELTLAFLNRLKSAKVLAATLSEEKSNGTNLTHLLKPKDPLTEDETLRAQAPVLELFRGLQVHKSLVFELNITQNGHVLSQNSAREFALEVQSTAYLNDGFDLYSLAELPLETSPLYLNSMIEALPKGSRLLVRIQALNAHHLKTRLDSVRKRSMHSGLGLNHTDQDITFEEATCLSRGLSSGGEKLFYLSALLILPRAWPKNAKSGDTGCANPSLIDPQIWKKETSKRYTKLLLESVTGTGVRHIGKKTVRLLTACDFIPLFCDPVLQKPAELKSRRGNDLEFDFMDRRLQALHWIVIGATGSGKSFSVGLLLLRKILSQSLQTKDDEKVSVLFLDSGYGFYRLTQNLKGHCFAPKSATETEDLREFVKVWLSTPEASVCIELSELPELDKKLSLRMILGSIEAFLRTRKSSHKIYVVFDEAWEVLKEDPYVVSRAYREYRKLGGAIIAITQNLSDFLDHPLSKQICQCAPIKVLLRQDEDLAPYQGTLSLNAKTLELAKSLEQKKPEFNEILIKTPFTTVLGRLYPTADEFLALETDNRQSILKEVQKNQSDSPLAAQTSLSVVPKSEALECVS